MKNVIHICREYFADFFILIFGITIFLRHYKSHKLFPFILALWLFVIASRYFNSIIIVIFLLAMDHMLFLLAQGKDPKEKSRKPNVETSLDLSTFLSAETSTSPSAIILKKKSKKKKHGGKSAEDDEPAYLTDAALKQRDSDRDLRLAMYRPSSPLSTESIASRVKFAPEVRK